MTLRRYDNQDSHGYTITPTLHIIGTFHSHRYDEIECETSDVIGIACSGINNSV